MCRFDSPLFVCLPVCLLACMFVCLSQLACLSVSLSACHSVCLLTCLHACQFVYLSASQQTGFAQQRISNIGSGLRILTFAMSETREVMNVLSSFTSEHARKSCR